MILKRPWVHKHADDLMIVWFDRRHEILIDAGRYGYANLLPPDSPLRRRGYLYGTPERQYVESTRAHNTVEADGSDHIRYGRAPYGSGLRAAEQCDGQFRICAEVDHGAWRHRREIHFAPGQWLHVADTVTALDDVLHDYRVWWNFPGDVVLRPIGHSALVVDRPDWEDPLWVHDLGGSPLITPVTAQRDPLRGWRSKVDQELTPAWSTGFEAKGVRDHEFHTVFSFGDDRPTVPSWPPSHRDGTPDVSP